MYTQSWIKEGALMLPKNKELQQCINEILDFKEEDEQLLTDQAKYISNEEVVRNAIWKNIWKKRARKLLAYKKRLAELEESQQA